MTPLSNGIQPIEMRKCCELYNSLHVYHNRMINLPCINQGKENQLYEKTLTCRTVKLSQRGQNNTTVKTNLREPDLCWDRLCKTVRIVEKRGCLPV